MDEAMPERWLPVVGYEGFYEVSDWGRVRSLPRKKCRGTILKPQPLPSGYLNVGLSVNNVVRSRTVHILVAAAFLGTRPPGMEVCHGDGNPANNRLGNLRYGTPAENGADMVRHGHTQTGTRHHHSTLTDADVLAIRSAWVQGERGCDLATRYAVSRAAISRLVNGHAYRQGEVLPRAHETCHYPQCGQPAREGTGGSGHPYVYCENPSHNAKAAGHERRRLALLDRVANCARCGKTFPLVRSNMIYCSEDCAAGAKLAQARARHARSAQGN